MHYPREFSSQARARVEAARLKAKRGLQDARTGRLPEDWLKGRRAWDQCAFYAYVLGVFSVFAREACDLGTQGTWTADRIRSETDEFIRRFTIEAYYENGHDRLGRMTSNWDGSLLPEVKRAFEDSDEWRQFEDDLLAVAERQSEGEPARTGSAPSKDTKREGRPNPEPIPPGELPVTHEMSSELLEPKSPQFQAGDQSELAVSPSRRIARSPMDNLPELPSKLQDAFQAAKAKAELAHANRRKLFPHHSHFAGGPLHHLILIQGVFFAFCIHARSACRLGFWTTTQVSHATDAAWPLICDHYLVRERGARSEQVKSDLRTAAWLTVTDDERWEQHLSELAALAERANVEQAPAAVPKTEQSALAQIMPVAKGDRVANPQPEFPNRASWLKDRLRERSWDKNDLPGQGGPDRKTAQKILDGYSVREDVLEKLAKALSKKCGNVTVLDIHQD